MTVAGQGDILIKILPFIAMPERWSLEKALDKTPPKKFYLYQTPMAQQL